MYSISLVPQQSRSPSKLYQGKKLKNAYNKDIDINEFVVQEEILPIKQFFDVYQPVYGQTTCLAIIGTSIVIGTQSSAILIFEELDNFSKSRQIGDDFSRPSHKGCVKSLKATPDQSYLACLFATNEIVIFHIEMKSGSEVHTFKSRILINKISFVPLNIQLQSPKSGYFELLVLNQQSNILKYTFDINITRGTLVMQKTNIYKFGRSCHQYKYKTSVPAKVYDFDYENDQNIIDFDLLDEKNIENIQYQPNRSANSQNLDETTSLDKSQSFEQEPKGFRLRIQNLKKLFKMNSQNTDMKTPLPIQFTLLAVVFQDKVEVLKLIFGSALLERQRIIKKILTFKRPDPYAYELVYGKQKESKVDQYGTCCWGLGSYKETNKRYALLVINWGGREYYSFKCMNSEFDVCLVQGGHFYLAQEQQGQMPLMTQFITNSIFINFDRWGQSQRQIQFITTLQFEYGLPFDLAQINRFSESEIKIQKMNQGQYSTRFSIFKDPNGENDVAVTQGLMDSIRSGYQRGLEMNIGPIEVNLTQENVVMEGDKCYILNGSQLMIVRLKGWNEYLNELLENEEQQKLFDSALDILNGKLTLLSSVPENDLMRHECTRVAFCKLSLTCMLIFMNDKYWKQLISEVRETLRQVQRFLLLSANEDYLFTGIEDLLSGSGMKDLFYSTLGDTLMQLESQEMHYNIPPQAIIKTFQELKNLDRLDIVQLITYSFTLIDFEIKPIIDFLMENDLIHPMIHLCSLVDDFLSPYLRIITVLHVKINSQQDDNMTRLPLDQLGDYALQYIRFCFTGTHEQTINKKLRQITFTEKQFKVVIEEIFQYLFDINNLNIFLQINFKESLQVLLLVFSTRIQEILLIMHREGKQVRIRLDKFSENGIMTEILNPYEGQSVVEQTLGRIYVLIKESELTYFSQLAQRGVDLQEYYDISAAFTVNVFTQGNLNMLLENVTPAICRYMTILRTHSLFDLKWVLKGRVIKDVDPIIMKSEFIWKMTKQVDSLHNPTNMEQSIFKLQERAIEAEWLYLHCWCRLKCGDLDEAVHLLVMETNLDLRVKVFEVLGEYQPQELMLKYALKLLECSQQRYFALLFLSFKDNLDYVIEMLSNYGDHELGAIDLEEREITKHISLLFQDYINLRTRK